MYKRNYNQMCLVLVYTGIYLASKLYINQYILWLQSVFTQHLSLVYNRYVFGMYSVGI